MFTQWPEWPHSLQNCAAPALMGPDAQTLMAGGSPVVQIWHQVKALRTKRASTWMSSAQWLQNETCSVAQEDLELRTGEGFNPASCLNSLHRGWQQTHGCIQGTQLQREHNTRKIGLVLENIRSLNFLKFVCLLRIGLPLPWGQEF